MIPSSVKDVVSFTPPRFDRAASAAALLAAEAAVAAATDVTRPQAELALASIRRHADQVEANIAARPGQVAPVYYIRPPTPFSRARARGEVARRGASVYPGDRDLIAAMRRVLIGLVDTAIDQRGALEFLDRWDATLQAEETVSTDDQAQIGDLMLYFQGHPLVSARLQARALWMAVMPLVACQMFVVGGDHLDFELDRRDDMLTDAALAAIPAADLDAIGWHAWGLASLSEADRKNSASLSSSDASPRLLPTGSTAAGMDGTSSA